MTSEKRKNVFILDDTLYERRNAKKVELAATVYDHAQHKFTRGFRLLTLGWSDGTTFLPVTSALLSSEKRQNVVRSADPVDGRTLAGKRRKQAQTKSPKVVLELLDQAIACGNQADYVLFDSWFCSPSALIDISKKDLAVIAMAKKTSKVHYLYGGKAVSAKEIYQTHRKRRGRSRYLLSVGAAVQKDGETLPVKLVFVRNRSKRKDYLILVTTDLTLSEEEVIQIYGKRWAIEGFFKVSKSYLNLAKNNRELSYDAACAHVAILFTQYLLLAVEQRQDADPRTFGELFFLCCDELQDLTFANAFLLIIQLFQKMVAEENLLTADQLETFLAKFLEACHFLTQKVKK